MCYMGRIICQSTYIALFAILKILSRNEPRRRRDFDELLPDRTVARQARAFGGRAREVRAGNGK